MSENLSKKSIWNGGKKPFISTYGKLMMWFFLISDALTFSGFLAAYGFMRFRNAEIWPVPEDVFTHFPFLQGEHPLLFVALMTFILIMSSVTMVLAVNAGNKNNKKGVVIWMALTIVGGATFLGSQAWEWGHFIHGDKGAIKLSNHEVVHVVDSDQKLYSLYDLMNVDKYDGTSHEFSIQEVETAFNARPDLSIKRANRTIVSHSESEEFFKNSEQLDTKFNILVQKISNKKEKIKFKGIGIMLQLLPQEEKFNNFNKSVKSYKELSEFVKNKIFDNKDCWNKISCLFENHIFSKKNNFKDIISDLLLQSFEENNIRVFEEKEFDFGCSCSVDKVKQTMSIYSVKEIDLMTNDLGKVTADCQFCGAKYILSPSELGYRN